MKKWEYMSINVKRLNDMTEFNEVGEQGWELVNVVPAATIGNFKGIFKREYIEGVMGTEILND